MVLEPSPWKPPQMPLTSRVGRAPRRSRGRNPGSPKSAGHAQLGREVGFVERQSRELLVLPWRQRAHLVVEARHGDGAVLVLERGHDARQRDGRVLDIAAVAARVQVDARAGDIHLRVHQAAQADGDGRVVALEEAGVADDRDVGAEAVPVGLQPGVEVGRTGLLLALEDVAHVDRQPALRFQPGAGGPGVQVHLALVIGGATGIDAPVLDARLEGRPLPEVERIDRLHVVVAVHQHRRGTVGVQPVGIDDRDARPSPRPPRAPAPSASAARPGSRPRVCMSAACSLSVEMLGMRRKAR